MGSKGDCPYLLQPDISFYPDFFSKERADAFFEEIYHATSWKQEKIKLYGKPVNLPRLTAWHGDPGAEYKYSGITVKPAPWIPALLQIKREIEGASGAAFNSVLLNLYRDGRDSVAWHSDDEPELGRDPAIGSVSFGGTRSFQFRHKDRGMRQEIALTHGSYLLMKGPTQHRWLHQVPKETKACEPRINLTFRMIRK